MEWTEVNIFIVAAASLLGILFCAVGVTDVVDSICKHKEKMAAIKNNVQIEEGE